jgi:hypothetical protein
MDIEENMEWEKEAAYLASLPRSTPYRVPDRYFNDLQSHINQAIFLVDLAQQENQGFKVPENYFQELGREIESRIAVDKLNSKVTVDGFKIPDHYFERLQTNLIKQTSGAEPKPKVFRLWQSEAMRYVSAACFIVLVASGLYLNQQYHSQQMAKTELASDQLLYDIDERVILEHLEESQTVSTSAPTDTEMENYILDNFSSSDLTNNL